MKQRGKKKKELKEMRTTSETSGTMSHVPMSHVDVTCQCHMSRFDIQIIGVPEEEDKKKGHKKILEEIIVKTSLQQGRK